MENIKAKFLSIPLRKQYNEYFSDNSKLEKMKNSFVDFTFGYKLNLKVLINLFFLSNFENSIY